jgi:hypothetical protein
MLTRSEQAVAAAYQRRRLVEAMAGGAGDDAAPSRSGRSAVGGMVLAALLVAAVWVRGVLAPGPPTTASACTADGAGMTLTATSARSVVAAPGRGAVVTADGSEEWVVAMDGGQHAGRYLVPAAPAGDDLLAATGLPPAGQAVRVPAAWLALFPEHGQLAADTWVRSHWAGARLEPLAALVCAELVAGGPDPYVRLATLPAQAAWTAPAPGEVTLAIEPAFAARAARVAPTAWQALIGR